MDKAFFDRKVKCGAEYVALRVIEDGSQIDTGGIVLSESAYSNNKLGFYIVEDVGETAFNEYGLQKGDYVLADRLSIFYKSEPVGIIKYNNIIVKTNKERTEWFPLKNMCFVEKEKNEVRNDGGIYIQNNSNSLQVGRITAKNMSDDVIFPFEVGDRVLLVKGADAVQIGQGTTFIYKHDMILCKIED